MSVPLKTALTEYFAARGQGDGLFTTEIDALTLMRSSCETLPRHLIYTPALCIVVQGAKQVMLGDATFHYGEMQSLIVSVELPMLGRVTRASINEPFLGITLGFDVSLLREVMAQLGPLPKSTGNGGLAVFVDDLDGPVADGVTRLIHLLGTPRAIPILSPSIMRELSFWLLTGRHGSEFAKLALPDSNTRRMADAIHLLREEFAQPLPVPQLAAAARMSVSSFHQHFKTLTAMTPLQYQKQLRLLEARRVMLAEAVSVTNAAYHVGYESPSQFSREYARMFGAPPKRDVHGLRMTPSLNAGD